MRPERAVYFHEKLREEHDIHLSYRWVKQALQGAGLAPRRKKWGPHRKRRPRRAMPEMMLHIDGSTHRWFQDDRYYDLIVILDDATSEIYYAQLVGEKSTRTVMAALREVIEPRGLFCALYSDRGSHLFVTPKAGGKVDKARLTQVGRAMKELGIQMIPAYSPQARGRMERSFSTWQNRLPQQLRLAGITTADEANRFLRERYIGEFNQKFTVAAKEKGTAFGKCSRRDLDGIFTIQTERVVANNNTVAIRGQSWQLEKSRWRHTLAGCTVTLHEHLDQRVPIRYGPHLVGQYDSTGAPLSTKTNKGGGGRAGTMEAVENRQAVSRRSHRPLEISRRRDSHSSTPATTSQPARKNSRRRAA